MGNSCPATEQEARAPGIRKADLIAALRLMAEWYTPGGNTPDKPLPPDRHILLRAAADSIEGLITREHAVNVCIEVRNQLSEDGNPIWHGAQHCVMALRVAKDNGPSGNIKALESALEKI